MVIYHFNRLIRNRFVWGVFAVIIAFAFVSVDSCTTSSSGRTDAGTLGNRKVPNQTYRTLEHYVRQTDRNQSALPQAILYTQTWERLAAAHTATKVGLSVSPELIQQEILASDAFAQGFDPNAYRYLLRQNLQMSEQEFEYGLANSIAVRLVGTVVGAATWASPMEIDDALAIYTDAFTLQHAVISNTFADAAIGLTEEDLLKYYESHRADYALPDRVSLRYIAVPVSNYVDAVTVTDADIIDYYDSNSQLFTRPADTNDPSGSTTIPLEEARPVIVEKLQLEQAADAAYAEVCHGLLEVALTNSLDAVAASLGLPVSTTPLFGADDFVPGFENGAELREKAFELDLGQAQTSFNAVRGRSVVYLIAAFSNDVARIPALAEVREQVSDAALVEARHKQYSQYINETRQKILAAVADGTPFDAAVATAGLVATTNYTFSINAGLPSGIPEINSVVREAIKLRTGAIAASEAPRFGNAVIVSVTERKPGDAMSAAFMRDQLRETVERRLFPPLFAEWSSWNLKQADFKPTPGTEPISPAEEAGDVY